MVTLDLKSRLEPTLSADARAFLERARAELAAKGTDHLPVLLPRLPRWLGREALPAERLQVGDLDLDLKAWRPCDAGGALLLDAASVGDEMLLDLFLRGDMEERTIVLRSLAIRPVTPATIRLLGEVQRTNTVVHVEAGVLDSNLAARALEASGPESGFKTADFHRLVLKLAFLDLPAWRMFGALDRADAELSQMLQGYATEREAAGRSVWIDTYRFLGHAPTVGSAARLVGGLEHGSDPVRLAAAEGLRALAQDSFAPFLEERLAREPRPAIQAVIREALTR